MGGFYAAWALAFATFLAVPRFAGAAIGAAVGAFGALLTFAALDGTAIAYLLVLVAIVGPSLRAARLPPAEAVRTTE